MNPSRRDFIKMAATGTALAGLNTYAAEPRNSKKPNLLLVFTDQQSFDMLGCYGNEQIQTPHLDRLASEGVRFEYCVSSTPVCTPMRGMLLSGQHPLKNGAISNDVCMLPGKGKYFGEVLRDNGYRTGYIGKWHLYGGDRNRGVPAGPHRYGFDDVFLSNNCQLNYDPNIAFYYDQHTGKRVKFNRWEVYGQTDQAQQFIEESPKDDPWALVVSWHPPHDHKGQKYTTLPELEKLYDPATIKLRPSQPDTPKVRKNMQGYMAMCTGCDIAFGRLMKTLKEQGMDDNTIVVFTSDHGDLHGAHGRPWAKSFPEDESCRVPLLIRYPGKLKPRASELLVGTLDLMPTILGMMGLPIPDTCDGQDLTPHLLSGSDDAVASVPLFYFIPSWRGVFTRDFTYSRRGPVNGKVKEDWNTLYDRKADPHQLTNRYYDDDYAAKREELDRLTDEWLARFEDPFLNGYEFIKALGFGSPHLSGKGKTGRLPGRPIDVLRQER
ncbi:MAG: sulfatase-like hydrolase/transferase [Lentisphaerae bacterium]|jgi:arylsulfatase A-like enzyme|nr:sulfatase-like hydrolase/transferase [Lentisphaerota bacterium]MBT5611178.1 sulfatase-like hydrolase/transferase [Lentisphaerota bacterium]MBT7054698.1 sulfatase-like hydrolase/transferase [Lentisphaerota bacterium]MBT7841956.1 sulfatase-like hydrolase/transferase [Lentisphaerota bacterium]